MTVNDQPALPQIQGNAVKREQSTEAHGRFRLACRVGFHPERLHSHFHWRVTALDTLKLATLTERYRGRQAFNRPVNFAEMVRLTTNWDRAYRSAHRNKADR